ncbi:MAG: hydroxyacylglutathione hydrolase family protein [bacterium]|nr:hydroxyacylglutathione hydrolase family protein [bacterium]
MIVERIWVGNRLRNYNYLIACAETGEALAVDPLDHERCHDLARARGFEITQILNTHEHGDHTGGNRGLIAATGAKLIAHASGGRFIDGIDRGVRAGDVIRVGRTIELECLDTPGHTLCHVCLLAHAPEPALFSGDTLFNAGAGNCHNGGHPELLFETFTQQLHRLDENAKLYPGHDYLATNLGFTLDREPQNAAAAALLAEVREHDGATAPVTTLGQEKAINTFFRLREPSVIDRLRESFGDLPAEPDDKAVFLRLRELRNRW